MTLSWSPAGSASDYVECADASRQANTSEFLFAVLELLLDFIRKSRDRSSKVLDFHHPHTLLDMMSHCLDIPEQPQNLGQILSDCKETLKYCVRTGIASVRDNSEIVKSRLLLFRKNVKTKKMFVGPSLETTRSIWLE